MFGGAEPAEPGFARPADDGWAALGAAERAACGHVRTRAIPRPELEALCEDMEDAADLEVPLLAAVVLTGAEFAALAATAPGQEIVGRWLPIFQDVLDTEDRDGVRRWLDAARPPDALDLPAPGASPATWGARVRADDVLFRVRTRGPCWLRRAPLPAAFHGSDTPLPVDADPIDAPGAFLDALAASVSEPVSWRTDLWLEWLHRVTPPELVVPLEGDAGTELLARATVGTPVHGPMLATLGERLLLSGAVVRTDSRVAAAGAAESAAEVVFEARGISDPLARRIFVGARDWGMGELDLRSRVLRELVVAPLREQLLGRTGPRSASALVQVLREAGGDGAVALIRDVLVGDGTVSLGEWAEWVGIEGHTP